MKRNGAKPEDLRKADFNLYKCGVVADLTISKWGAFTKLRPEDLGLKTVPDVVHLGHKELMDGESLKEIDSPGNKAQDFLYSNSYAFPIGFTRFIPYNILEAVLDKMDEYQKERGKAVKTFVSEHYREKREAMMVRWSKAFDEMLEKTNPGADHSVEKAKLMQKTEAKYPSETELEAKFGFDFVVFEIANPELKEISGEQAIDKAKVSRELTSQFREKISKRFDVFLDSAGSRLKGMILETTDHMKGLLSSGKINQNTVKAFGNFVQSFKRLDFIGYDRDIEKAIADFEVKLNGAGKSDLSDEQFLTQLNKDIDQIKEMASRSDVSEILGKFKRRMIIDNKDKEEAKA
jgi:hypothetical protein